MSDPVLPRPIDSFVDAVHHGDTQTFLDFFPKNGVVVDSGRRFVGHDAIRRWSDREFIGAHGHMTVKRIKQEKNVLTIEADWKSSFYTGPASSSLSLKANKLASYASRGDGYESHHFGNSMRHRVRSARRRDGSFRQAS